MKKQSIHAKKCKRLRVFLSPKYPYSHIFYILLHQENQDLANATHPGCSTGAFGNQEEHPSASNSSELGFYLKTFQKH